MYGVSKLCEATYTRILARQLQGRHIHVNACCPGYCATEMSSWRGQKTAVGASEHAAQVHLHAQLLQQLWVQVAIGASGQPYGMPGKLTRRLAYAW